MRRLLLLSVLLIMGINIFAQIPVIQWQKSLGGTDFDEARMTFATFGDPWNEGRIIFKTIYMSKVPIPDIKNNIGKLIGECVEKILSIIKCNNSFDNLSKIQEVKELESKIDELVMNLYGLTKEEREVVGKS